MPRTLTRLLSVCRTLHGRRGVLARGVLARGVLVARRVALREFGSGNKIIRLTVVEGHGRRGPPDLLRALRVREYTPHL